MNVYLIDTLFYHNYRIIEHHKAASSLCVVVIHVDKIAHNRFHVERDFIVGYHIRHGK